MPISPEGRFDGSSDSSRIPAQSYQNFNFHFMKNKLKAFGALALALAIIVLPSVSSADAFGTSTVSAIILQFITDVAVIIGTVIAVILSLVAAMHGLGWGVRKFRHYVSGKKF